MKYVGPDSDWTSDPRATPDAFEAELERALAPARFDVGRRPLHIPAEKQPIPLRTRVLLLAAAAAVVAAISWTVVHLSRDPSSRHDRAAFEVVGTTGDVEWDPSGRLECGAGSSARLRVGSIGSVELSEHSRLTLEEGGEGGYRVFLERGTLTASIFAAPRLFAVGTPSGLAVDLGCVYRTHVEDDGSARLEVVSGRVSFEADGVHALVPAGAECRARPGRGPGLPRWSDASAALIAALDRFDLATVARERAEAIAALIVVGERRDSLTLFHLLERAQSSESEPIVARLESWSAIPPAIDRSRLVDGDLEALLSLRDELRETW